MDHEPDDSDEDRNAHERQGDPAETVEGARPVDPRRVVELRRNALQAGEKQDHGECAVPPDGVEDQRRHGKLRVGEDGGVAETEGAERGADQSGIAREHPAQQKRADQHRYDIGHQSDGAHGDIPARVAFEIQRQGKADREREGEGAGGEDRGGEESGDDHGRGEDAPVIAEAAKLGQLEEVDPVEAVVESDGEGDGDEQYFHHHQGQDEAEGPQFVQVEPTPPARRGGTGRGGCRRGSDRHHPVAPACRIPAMRRASRLACNSASRRRHAPPRGLQWVIASSPAPDLSPSGDLH